MVDVPKEVSDKVLQLLEEIKSSGKLRKGTNETTKSVERGEAKLVVVASDTNPKEIVMHLPILCEEKKIPYVEVPTKTELGAAAGLPVGTSAIAVAEPGEAGKKLSAMVEQLNTLAKKAEAPKEEPKKDTPKPEPKAEPTVEETKEDPSEKEEKPAEEEKEVAAPITA